MKISYIGSMKKKPLLITIICLLVAAVCVFAFVKAKYFRKADANEIAQFIKDFDAELRSGNTDSLDNFFADSKSQKVAIFLKVLTGKTGLNGKAAPLFKIALDVDNLKILSANTDMSVVKVPVSFLENGSNTDASFLTFSIMRVADHQYKFVKIKTEAFIKDYLAYENKMRMKNVPDNVAFNALTLNAFKNAEKLKAKYDSVLFFDHVNGKTYYYVVKGAYKGTDVDSVGFSATYKMGLVNPELQEIIPADYDLVRTVNGIADGLVEVQKGKKRGLYNLAGKLVAPVNYDQIFPLTNDDNLAVLRNGDDFFYLKSDTTVGEKLIGFNIADVLPKIKFLNHSFKLTDSASTNIMEFNSRTNGNALVIAPSFLVDLGLIENTHEFTNPLRKYGEDGDGNEENASAMLSMDFKGAKSTDKDWLASAFYSLYDDFVGGRGGLYQSNAVILADRNKNRLIGFSISAYQGEEEGEGVNTNLCNENAITALGDSLYEFKTTSGFYQDMPDGSFLVDGPCYHYLKIENGKLTAQSTDRLFGCTQFVKLNDSYLKGCYVLSGKERNDKNKAVDHLTPELLRYMKNEIYASYGYQFKNLKWDTVFMDRFHKYYNQDGNTNANVNDSLTAIDKYNITWIDQKLKQQQQAGAVAMNNR